MADVTEDGVLDDPCVWSQKSHHIPFHTLSWIRESRVVMEPRLTFAHEAERYVPSSREPGWNPFP